MKKRIGICIVLVVLTCLFIGYAVFFKYPIQKNSIMEDKMVNFLNTRYNKNFEVVSLTDKRQYENPAIDCDGSTFIPARKVKDVYEYVYNVNSKEDNISFDVYCMDNKGDYSFKDSYVLYRDIESFTDRISNSIEKNLNTTAIDIKAELEQRKVFALNYKYNYNIYLNTNLMDVLDMSYASKISYINKINNIHREMDVIREDLSKNYTYIYNENIDTFVSADINIHYSDGSYININKGIGNYVFNTGEQGGIPIESFLNIN